MNRAADKSEAAILDRVFRPNAGDWPRAAADAILNIGFDPRDNTTSANLELIMGSSSSWGQV
jgi:hypothetical protein